VDRTRRLGTVTAHTGVVDVTNQVVAYQRRRAGTGEVLAEFPLDLPARQLRTRAVWLTLDDTAVRRAELDDAALPGALHAAEHASIGILPLLATCDRWDLGGVSTALHPDTARATIVVYDGHPGGAGFAERGFGELRRWLTATRATVASCECESGCPSCVQSPKCGNGNEPLDKAGAVRVLDVVLDELAAAHDVEDDADGDDATVDGDASDAGTRAAVVMPTPVQPAVPSEPAPAAATPAGPSAGGRRAPAAPRAGRVRVGRAAEAAPSRPAPEPAEDDLVF
jgi:DEAD/DEAH box helicase domain-containing protein